MHTKESLKKDLAAMGLKPSDTVLVHTSMKAIGPVEGGADAVLDAVSKYFADGLVAFPALTWELASEEDPVFYTNDTPSIVGLLPEMFRKRPGVARSMHPTHSVCALGRDAAWLVSEDHLGHTPCGPKSAWHKLLERNAHVLMIGCGMTSCTFMHGVEEWANVPDRIAEPVRFTIVAPDGRRFPMLSSPHKGSPSEQYGRIEPLLRKKGALIDGRFGDARVLHLFAEKTFQAARSALRENPRLFSKDE